MKSSLVLTTYCAHIHVAIYRQLEVRMTNADCCVAMLLYLFNLQGANYEETRLQRSAGLPCASNLQDHTHMARLPCMSNLQDHTHMAGLPCAITSKTTPTCTTSTQCFCKANGRINKLLQWLNKIFFARPFGQSTSGN